MFLILMYVMVCCCAAASPPNLIMLFVDDLGYGDLGFSGHPTIPTPHLNRMAQEGLILDQWYSAYPTCSPSRAALMTGRLPRRSGINRVFGCDAVGGIPSNETLLPELLKQQNYATAHLGKWHLGQRPEYLPTRNGFDYYFGIPFSADMGGLPPDYEDTNCVWLPLLENERVIEQPVDLWGLGPRYADAAVQFITKNQNKPFFLYMAFNHVHVTIPPVKQWASPKFANSTLRGGFGDAVAEMDWITGQILDTLRALKLDTNTLVMFSSDNGPWLIQQVYAGSAGLFREGKFTTWEGGIRMPALAWWPGKIAPNTRTTEIVSTMDVFTTFATLAGSKIPTDRIIDGKDISNVLFNNGPSPHDYLFFWLPVACIGPGGNYSVFAVRHGPYKVHYYTVNATTGQPAMHHDPPLLYNVEQDPGEYYALNTTQYQNVLSEVAIALKDHLTNINPAFDQASLGNDNKYSVCCDWTKNCHCSHT